MKKRFISILLLCAVLLSSLPLTATAVGLENFQKQYTYQDNFTDVKQSSWYYDNVKSSFEYGLVNGNSPTTFNPGGNITRAELYALVARLHKMYYSGNTDFAVTTPWYDAYGDYIRENNLYYQILQNPNRAVKREEVAEMISSALPDEALQEINRVDDNTIPDLKYSRVHIYRLYRAGIIGGNDEQGTFTPDNPIRRSEISAILSRIVDPSLRLTFSLVTTPPENDYVSKETVAKIVDGMIKIAEEDEEALRFCIVTLQYLNLYEMLGTHNYLQTAQEAFLIATVNAMGSSFTAKQTLYLCEQYSELEDVRANLNKMIAEYDYISSLKATSASELLTKTNDIINAYNRTVALISEITAVLNRLYYR